MAAMAVQVVVPRPMEVPDHLQPEVPAGTVALAALVPRAVMPAPVVQQSLPAPAQLQPEVTAALVGSAHLAAMVGWAEQHKAPERAQVPRSVGPVVVAVMQPQATQEASAEMVVMQSSTVTRTARRSGGAVVTVAIATPPLAVLETAE